MRGLFCLLSGIVLAAALPSVRAQDATVRIALKDLLGEALQNNREILAAQKRYEAMRQRPSQASSLPDPMFSTSYNSVGSPRPVAGLGREVTANIGLMVSQMFPFPGKLKLKGEMAGKEADAEFQQYQSAQLSVVSRLKQAYYRLDYAYAAKDVLERNRDLLNKLLRVTENRYSVGKAMQQDVFKAQTQLSLLETRLVKLEQERQSREAEINSLLNRRPGTPLGRPEPAAEPKILPATIDELYSAASANSPMLRRDQKMIESAQLGLNMARKEYYPDYTLTAGYFNQGSMSPMYMVRADFTIPAFFWRKQRAGVAEQAANAVQARHAYEATNQELHFKVKDDYAMAQASDKLIRLYKETVIPQANLTLESSLQSYDTGGVDFLTVLSNFSMVLEYEMSYYDELANYQMALSRLEEMTGQRLTN